jgi:calcium-dependent protein kinase
MGICVFCARDEGIVPINYNINLEENLNNNEKKEEKIQNTTSDKIEDKKIFKFEPNISNETNIQKNLQYDGHKELINNFKNETLEMNKINKNNSNKTHKNIVKFNVSNKAKEISENNNKEKKNKEKNNHVVVQENVKEKEKNSENILHLESEECVKEKEDEKIKQKYKRKKKAHKTTFVNSTNHSSIATEINNDLQSNPNVQNKYKRRNKKSTTLVEKSRLGYNLFKEELKLVVSNQTIIDEQTGDPTLKYKVLNKLGDGSYGTVFSAINILTGTKIAMKRIEKIKENEIDDLQIKNEIDILKKLDHPNIVKIFEFYDTKKNYYIITEYCKHGELYGYIKYSYSEKQLAVLFYQVFSGLCYLHDNHILHRDLKLENIMISEIEKDLSSNSDFFWIKIIDFGTAKIFKKSKNEKTVVGSSYYIAPEVLKQKYNEKCDTWSVGVILYMLIVGRAPFDGKTDEEIIENIKKGKFNKKHPKLKNSSEEVQNLVCSLLETNIKKRLSSKEALNHIWFKKYNGRSLFSNFNEKDIDIYIDHLLTYKYQSKFQQLVLAFIVHNIPHSHETKTILKLFRYFNTSGDCKLTKKELITGLYQYRTSEVVNEVIDDIFLLLDGDNNGYIEYEEFLRACMDKKRILTNDALLYAFRFLDKDEAGTLNVKKIMYAFLKKHNKVLEEIIINTIKEVDHDNDGIIDFQGFKELMLNIQ